MEWLDNNIGGLLLCVFIVIAIVIIIAAFIEVGLSNWNDRKRRKATEKYKQSHRYAEFQKKLKKDRES